VRMSVPDPPPVTADKAARLAVAAWEMAVNGDDPALNWLDLIELLDEPPTLFEIQ
jgi:hypothetical protein